MPIIGSIGAGSARGFGQRGKGKGPPQVIDYLIISGGGGGSPSNGGGAGAGGFRISYDSPLATCSITIDAGTYDVVVGAGGSGGGSPGSPPSTPSTQGNDSTFNPGGTDLVDSITSTGGGIGSPNSGCRSGGSGGGFPQYAGGSPQSGTGGNAGGYSPPEGQPGGGVNTIPCHSRSSGGGGAGGAGQPDSAPTRPRGHDGGPGVASSITGSPVTRGGGGASGANGSEPIGFGGPGGGGNGANSGTAANAGAAGTGGGGGAGGDGNYSNGAGKNGGSGVVIIRLPGCRSISVSPCANTITSCVGPTNDKVATFNTTGTFTLD
jgi:hypothetical protein